MKILNYTNINNTKSLFPKILQKNKYTNNEQNNIATNNRKNKKISFGKKEINIIPPGIIINSRIKKLTELGVSDFYSERIATLDNEKYKKAIVLLSSGVFEEGIEDTVDLDEEKYKQALELVNHNIINEDLASLANLEGESYRRVIELKDNGIDTEQISLFTHLNHEEYKEAKLLMKKGYTPVEAASLAGLSKEQKEIALSLLKINTQIETASEIVRMEPKQREICLDLIHRGIKPEEAELIANLKESEKNRLDDILSMNVGDDNIVDFAKFSNESYKKAISLFQQGVLPEYISSIINIEDGKTINKEYEEYRKRGYSRSVSYSLSLLENEEIDALAEIIKKNQQIKKLLTQEYDINIIELQNSNKPEAIFSKEIRSLNGTLITIVQTFDIEGNSTRNRVEEYSNHATSSILSGKSDVYKAKYDKFGEIKELTQFIQDPKDNSVIGVIHSKASTILPGVLESVYYDISKFKESNSNNNDEVNYDIENAVKSKGIPITTVSQEEDGTIVYRENYKYNEILTNRTYRERRNKEGNVIYSYYSYIIRDKNNKNLMNIERVYKKHNNNSATHVINGVTYKLRFDDKNKEITISDGIKTRTISFKDKLAYFAQDILWETIKTLPVDTLLTINKNIEKWNFCREEDSVADGYTHTISTGKIQSIITHETGHFKDYETLFSMNNKEFLKSYNEEMKKYLNMTPFNEQEFIQYFSPRAMLYDATGTNEFAAETNLVLTTYGTNYEKLKTRAQLLVRYFPKTIAITAKLLGKTSKKSLLEED